MPDNKTRFLIDDKYNTDPLLKISFEPKVIYNTKYKIQIDNLIVFDKSINGYRKASIFIK